MEENAAENIQNRKANNFLPASIIVAALLISASIVYWAQSQKSVGQEAEVSVGKELAAVNPGKVSGISERDVVLGDPKAPITVIVYGDYQCPFCAKFFEETELPLRENYIKTGKVNMVHRNFVFVDQFPGGKEESHLAAEAVECAKDERQFWAYHDALYRAEGIDGVENNGNLNRELLLQLAVGAKLNAASFTACIDSRKYKDEVIRQTEAAAAAGINSTPTLVINGQKYVGALPFEISPHPSVPTLKSIIDNFLEKK